MNAGDETKKLDQYQIRVYCNIGFEMENSRIVLTKIKAHEPVNPLLLKRALEIANEYYDVISQSKKDFRPVIDDDKREEALLYLGYVIQNKKKDEEEALKIIRGLERIVKGKQVPEEVINKGISFFERLVQYTKEKVEYSTWQGHF